LKDIGEHPNAQRTKLSQQDLNARKESFLTLEAVLSLKGRKKFIKSFEK